MPGCFVAASYLKRPSAPLWRRISTVMQLSGLGMIENMDVGPRELHEALVRDGVRTLECSSTSQFFRIEQLGPEDCRALKTH
jgi:hypothetical protein